MLSIKRVYYYEFKSMTSFLKNIQQMAVLIKGNQAAIMQVLLIVNDL